MRSFAQLDRVIGQVPSSVVRTLRLVDTGRGSEALHRDQLPGLLSHLAQRARVESITASSAIEGVVVSDTRWTGGRSTSACCYISTSCSSPTPPLPVGDSRPKTTWSSTDHRTAT